MLKKERTGLAVSLFFNCCAVVLQSRAAERLVVLGLYLEVSLWMVADGAYVGSLGAYDDVSAVGALPDDIAVLGEDAFFLYVVQQTTVAFLG